MLMQVKGMTCGGCVRSVTKALERAGGEAVKVELASGRVELSGQIAPEQARAAVEKAGFEVASVG
jgi:copper chaperone